MKLLILLLLTSFTLLSNNECPNYRSPNEEFTAPVQIIDMTPPAGTEDITWTIPSEYTSRNGLSGVDGKPAGHEGIDFLHTDQDVEVVPVVAVADGIVVYVRVGCPQSSMFYHNTLSRECGAGWGNHIVVQHENGSYTRYGHLEPNSITVKTGTKVAISEKLGNMGNSGRSELRHLHFEFGSGVLNQDSFDPCSPSQSFNRVHDLEDFLF